MSTDNQEPERRIEYIDGVRILSGYTDEEYFELLLQEAQEAYRQRYWQEVAQRQPAQRKRRKAS